MAHGTGRNQSGEKVRRYSFSYFKSPDEIRRFIANVFEASKLKKLRGRIIKFNPKLVNSNRYITLLGNGSLRWQGARIGVPLQLHRECLPQETHPNLRVAIPKTAVIGVDEFDNFLETNNLYDVIFEDKEYDHVLEAFRTARLSEKLRDNLRKYLQVMTKPLAVRSSRLFEDSLNQPFAGVYSTYLLPNNHPDFERRLEDFENAIKLVFASIYCAGIPEQSSTLSTTWSRKRKWPSSYRKSSVTNITDDTTPKSAASPSLTTFTPSPISTGRRVRRHCHRVGSLRHGW
ncbi:MAG: PEP/pyruvate-binding domain-containing protein [Butyricimonas faecihominis]